jgi:hypothetical protein
MREKLLGRNYVSRHYRFRVRLLASSLALALFLSFGPAATSGFAATRPRMGQRRIAHRSPAVPRASTRIAVQPIAGEGGSALRAQVAQLLRSRGFRVDTSLAAVTGTAQYPGLARDNSITAFVVGDIENRTRRRSITFLVWTGSDGSVLDRWSVAAEPGRLGDAVSRGFWPQLGRALTRAKGPRSASAPVLAPARPMRIDASDELDEPLVSNSNYFRRRRPTRD